jgi:hypothetical protein
LVALVADANGDVVPDPARGVDAAKPRTGIHTSLVFAGKFSGAVLVENTLRAAIWRGSYHAVLTVAVTAVVISSWRTGIGATGVRVARIFFYNWLNS